jgi:proteasome accessory factor C
MPKQELGAEEQFNLALSIVGLVLREGPHDVVELARYFQVSEAAIKKAVLTIANSEDMTRFETHFYVDEEALEDGEVALNLGVGRLDTPPKLSGKQAAAIAAGLEYLSAVKPFSESEELSELRRLFGSTAKTSQVSSPSVDLSLDAVQKAIVSELQVEIDYLNQLGERSLRAVDPLRLDLWQGRYYLRGWCHKNQDLRAFRLDRVIEIKATNKSISSNARNAKLPDDSFGESETEQVVKLEVEKTATEIFWNFPLVSQAQERDGVVVGEIRVGSFAALARHIAKFGGRARVLAPVEAKNAVAQFAKRTLNLETAED